ncbi:MAG: DUF3078 domain-containing protein [Bacteroidales bacterium]|nr:DUF3078 domain-containing protein [Bacteroidales bacterium]
MKKIYLILALVAGTLTASAQTDEVAKEVAGLAKKSKETVVTDSAKPWKLDGMLSLTASQTSLKNWAAGGDQQIGVNILGNFNANYAKNRHSWQNSVLCQYGALRLIDENDEFRKTDDKFQFSSKYGYALSQKWYYSAIFDYKSQWAKGWTYNDKFDKNLPEGPENIYRTRNSSCWSPLYLTYTIGLDFQPNEHFSLYLSPLCGKTTVVLNDTLASHGAFGVEENKNVRSEIGWYVKANTAFNITKQASLNSNITLFQNYKDGGPFDEVDIDWNLILTFQINKWLAFSFVSELIYDEDIAIAEKDHPEITHNSLVQFKDVIGVGLTFKF